MADYIYLIYLRHAFQKLSKERPQAHIHLHKTENIYKYHITKSMHSEKRSSITSSLTESQ